MRLLLGTMLLCLAYCLPSCKSLGVSSAISHTGLNTIALFKQVDYTFTNSYYDFTFNGKLYDFSSREIHRKVLHIPPIAVLKGEPEISIQADQALRFFNTSLAAYYQALDKLNPHDLTSLNFDDLSRSIQNDTLLKKRLKITDDSQVTAAATLGNVLASAFVSQYTRRKVQEVMVRYDFPLSVSIQTLENVLSKGLLAHLNDDVELLKTDYQLVLANPDVSLSRKTELVEEYGRQMQRLDKNRKRIAIYIAALEKIKNEHHDAVIQFRSSSLNSPSLIALAARYNAAINQLADNMESLR